MAKKTLSIRFGLIQTTYFDSYADAAERLGIKNGSRKAIETHCKGRNMIPEFDD